MAGRSSQSPLTPHGSIGPLNLSSRFALELRSQNPVHSAQTETSLVSDENVGCISTCVGIQQVFSLSSCRFVAFGQHRFHMRHRQDRRLYETEIGHGPSLYELRSDRSFPPSVSNCLSCTRQIARCGEIGIYAPRNAGRLLVPLAPGEHGRPFQRPSAGRQSWLGCRPGSRFVGLDGPA
jgi:hypothetical protein